jgi:hypothetical protein
VSVTTPFLAALKLSRTPQYELAREAGMDDTLLSKLIQGARPIRPGHVPALQQIGRRLGVAKVVTARGPRRRSP